MHATYHEATKRLIVTQGHEYVFRTHVSTSHHLRDALSRRGLRLKDGKYWKQFGNTHTAEVTGDKKCHALHFLRSFFSR
jgi:hypothetical protein